MDVLPPMNDLMDLNFTRCSIPELPKYQFKNVPKLNWLTLIASSLEVLSNETFEGLSLLKYLSLQNNLIKILPERVFTPLSNLYSLNLNNNNISTLSNDIFLRNSNLKEIGLRGNPLKIVSLEFPIWTYNTIISLDLSNCEELRDLRLSIRVTDLSLETSGVESLQLTGSIDKIVHKNSKVTRADLSGTNFTQSFVKVLCDLPSLEWLDLSNSSKNADDSFFELYRSISYNFTPLRFLNLSRNQLNNLPRRLSLFGANLTTLDLSRNLLDDTSLENLFDLDTPHKHEGNFPNLRFLNMARNKLEKIPQRFPLFGPNLTILNLSDNLLVEVSLESLAEAQNLQRLYLGGNRLISFDYLSICETLKNLNRLTLYENTFNATFTGNMTKYFGDKGFLLITRKPKTRNRTRMERKSSEELGFYKKKN
ncbi:leucine-rich repeat-containing protein 15-like [Drosophila serrata]|uniref:leucine-rich repeat-containing protein 15-like n=1 Tax=Drosophila serrata TaxID=7274 RepID=UPI000A1D2102|nr:leucine-rich repeat-containing protein 15-like [Drosophila serrata]